MEEYLEDLQVNEEVLEDEEDNILVRLLAVLILLANAICNEIDRRPGRAANLKRDRSIPLTSIQNWDEEMFGRQLRLKREDFNHVLDSYFDCCFNTLTFQLRWYCRVTSSSSSSSLKHHISKKIICF